MNSRQAAGPPVTRFEAWLIVGLGALLLYVLVLLALEEPSVHIAGRLTLPPAVAASNPDTATLLDAETGDEVGGGGLGSTTFDGQVVFSGSAALADSYVIRVGAASATASLHQLKRDLVRLTHSSSSSEWRSGDQRGRGDAKP